MKAFFLLLASGFLCFGALAQNVGIGTTTPTLGGLVVDKKVGAVNAIFGTDEYGVSIEGNYPGIGLNSYYNGGRKVINTGFGALMGMDPGSGRFYYFNTATSATGKGTAITMQERFSILANGNVGIGIINPGAKLDIAQTTSSSALNVNNTNAAGLAILAQAKNHRAMLALNNSGSLATIEAINTGGGPALATIGNVGINLNDPEFPLDISGRVRLRNDGFTPGIWFNKADNTQGSFIGQFDNNSFGIWGPGAVGNWKFNFNTTTGNMGINTNTPNSKLQVQGGISLPVKVINDSYQVTDDDYSIIYMPTQYLTGTRIVTLPPAAGRTGRIYVIMANVAFAQTNYCADAPQSGCADRIKVVDNTNTNIFSYSPSVYNNSGSFYNYLGYFQLLSNGAPIVRHTSITVQSTGSFWVIIGAEFN